jgi:hypothetical protein
MAISKGLEQDRHAAFDSTTDSLANQLAQLVHAGSRRVEDQVGGVGNRLQQRLFLLDRFRQAQAVATQWMTATRLAIALQQDFLVGP